MDRPISVVVCIKNERARIVDCLESIRSNNPDEIIVVDGNSTDGTVALCANYTDKIIVSRDSNLTRDRQKGIDAARNELVALIDADHRLQAGDLASLARDLDKYGFDIVQSQLRSFSNNNWMNKAEEEMWALNHNRPGPRAMIGVAPALYRKDVFNRVRFDDTITKTIDDTDFIYRLSRIPGITYGIGDTVISQLHDSSCASYMKKFKWYGIGDGEFCIKHKERMASMLFHLFIRYPVIYASKALLNGKFYAIPYQIIQGCVRGWWALRTLVAFRRSVQKT